MQTEFSKALQTSSFVSLKILYLKQKLYFIVDTGNQFNKIAFIL